MKKILIGLILMVGLYNSSFGASYDFSHFPVNNYKVDTYKKRGDIEYYKYSGRTPVKTISTNINPIEELIKEKGYFKFFRYGYYHKNLFREFSDSRINLRQFNGERLEYPIAVTYIGDYLYIFIYYKNFSNGELKIIGNYYKGGNFALKSEGNWITTRLKIGTVKNINFRPYQYKSYFTMIKKSINNSGVLNIQLGQNPTDIYILSSTFSDYFIQLDTVSGGLMKGVLVSMKSIFSSGGITKSEITSESHDKYYSMDVEMMKNLNSLNEAVNDFFNNNLSLPKGITSLVPNYISLEAFNSYNHNLKYKIVSSFCFKAGMLPKSNEFKTSYKTQIESDGYIYVNYCVK